MFFPFLSTKLESLKSAKPTATHWGASGGQNYGRSLRSFYLATTRGQMPLRFLPDAGDSTAVRLSAPGAVRHDVANQVAHVVLQISDDVLDDVSDRDHAHDLARVQHW